MQPKILPGMIDSSIEFFQSDDGRLKYIHQGKVNCINEMPFAFSEIIKDEISKNPEIENHLKDFHPDSEIKRLHQFISCRFGGVDYQGDIKENVLQEGEYWPCPLRGTCKSEGVLCKIPKINGNDLSSTEIKIIQMSTTDMTNDVIADALGLCQGTFNKMKKIVYEKLNVPTKQCLTKIAHRYNII